jgi:ubiquinol-cytochrome c reductase cytochrome c subunit
MPDQPADYPDEGKAVTDDQLDGEFDGDLDFTPAVDGGEHTPAKAPRVRSLRRGRADRATTGADARTESSVALDDAPASSRKPSSAAGSKVGPDKSKPGKSKPGNTKPGERSLSKVWRRRISGVLVLGAALVGSGMIYGAIATSSSADDTTSSAADVQAGKTLYSVTCISCHGANLEGVEGRGPTLIGVGSAAVYFQVSSGRMPAVAQGAQEPRKKADFTDEQVRQLAAYVQSVGGGPELPSGNLQDGNIAEGGELFRLNCAACHNFAGEGAPLSAGKYAPSLKDATDAQIYAVMLTGSQNMPTFGDNQLTPEQKRSIIAYVQSLKASNDPGGAAIGRAGPVPEGLVIFMIGIAGLMGVIMWIGAKSS